MLPICRDNDIDTIDSSKYADSVMWASFYDDYYNDQKEVSSPLAI